MAKTRSKTGKKAKTTTTARRSPGRAASKAAGTRERMHRFATEAIADGHVDLDRLREATSATFAGVRDAVAKAMPGERDNILRQTFDGLAGAVAAGADSARRAMDRAKTAGRRISHEEWATFAHQMKSLEKRFLESVGDAAEGMTDEAKRALDEIVRRARKVGTDIGPAAAKAASTAARNAPDLAAETAKASGRAAAALASEFAMGVSGLLSGIGSALAATSTSKRAAKPLATRSAGKAAVASKPKKKVQRKDRAARPTSSKARPGKRGS